MLDSSDAERLSPAELSDLENPIMHELIHLELSALPKTDASRRDQEFAVDRLAVAFSGDGSERFPARPCAKAAGTAC